MVLYFLVSLEAIAQTSTRVSTVSTSKSQIDKKVEREITKAEGRLGQAIRKRDVAALDLLLADYYADAYEGRERAVDKGATLAKCRAGMLDYYKIQAGKKLTARGDIMQIEGIGRREEKLATDTQVEKQIRLTRLWTRENGRWVLIAQNLQPVNSELKK